MRLFPSRYFLLSGPPDDVVQDLHHFIRPEGVRAKQEDRWYVGSIGERRFKMRRDYVKSGYYKEKIRGSGDSFGIISGKVESHLNGSRVYVEIMPGKLAYRALIAMCIFAAAFGLWWGFSLIEFSRMLLFLFLPLVLMMYLIHLVSALVEIKTVDRDLKAFFTKNIYSGKEDSPDHKVNPGDEWDRRPLHRLKT